MSAPVPVERPFLQLALLAVLAGALGAAGAVLFRALVALAHNLFFLGTLSLAYDANHHTPPGPWGWGVVLAPVVGGLGVVWLVRRFAPEARGHGVPEVMDAIHHRGGAIRPRVALVKALASALSIGSGGAVGREGPIVQIASTLGSALGGLARLPAWQRVTLVASGAGAGIAATFNTPIGGLLFAVELMLTEVSHRTLVPVALACGTATYLGRLAFGDFPAFLLPEAATRPAELFGPGVLAAWTVLGVLLGLASLLYIRAIYWAEDRFQALPLGPYARHALGMLGVGAAMTALMAAGGHYYIQGIGYATIQDVLLGTLTSPGFLLLLFLLKLAATSVTIGSGGSGGIFSPALFLGATLGGAYALALNQLVGLELDVATTAMIGMAGLVAGATGAAVTALVMVFEMTRDYNVIMPALIAASLAYGVRRHLLPESIYTLKLMRRGSRLPEGLHTNTHLAHPVRELLGVPVAACAADDPRPLGEVLGRRGRLPHLLGVRQGRVAVVANAAALRRADPALPVREALARHGHRRFLVASPDEPVLELFLRLRQGPPVAVVVAGGADPEAVPPDRVLGVVSWEMVAEAARLPEPLCRRVQTLEAPGTRG